MKGYRVSLAVAFLLCAGLLGIVSASAAMAQPASRPWLGTTSTNGLVVEVGIGCRLVGGAIVCGRDGSGGGLLEKPLRRRKKVQEQPVQKKTYPAKKPSSSSGGSKTQHKSSGSSGGGSVAPAPSEPAEIAPAEIEPDAAPADAEPQGQHACPPGNVVLESPNAAGSYCEPVGASKAPETPAAQTPAVEAPADTPKTPSAAEVAIPDDIRGAACAPGGLEGGCACPAGAEAKSDACRAALPWCCSAQGVKDGNPVAVFNACAADQNAAMSKVVTSAINKQLSLGPVRCSGQ
ncbi:hypothetical protein A7A08_01295 [Methyloligella halotolerans]|uniref:Uncharacterized protein n=1 Tax=Methyloligella halotolerans TaxID=1177755 RepID=A0A1E2S1C2_9HYPH|nr:hypothetical protein [Methyloligella halotolerans]ODA68125.1 hypothetical protein A7A08_01295 [Methyloligella halotolerans]